MFYRGLVKPWIIIWFYRTCRISLCSISQSSQVLSNRVTKIANSTKKSQKYNQVYIKRNSRCLSFNLIKERYPVRGLRPWSDLENRVPRIQGPSNISRIYFSREESASSILINSRWCFGRRDFKNIQPRVWSANSFRFPDR